MYNNMIAFSDFVDNVIGKIESSRKEINDADFKNDLTEFERVYQLATETSTLGSAFLGFNQGIPGSKTEILSQVLKMQRAITDREKIFKITQEGLMNPEKRGQIIIAIKNNNPLLDAIDIEEGLNEAMILNIVENFDFYQWLYDKDGYRKATADYYNLIKGTWNIFDMIDKLPHFNAIFEALKTILVMDQTLLRKS